jgi:large subunit ribosomal protein L30
MAQNTIRVKLVKGLAGCKSGHRATVRGLGLKRLQQSVELADTPAVRGMINRVKYLVRVE